MENYLLLPYSSELEEFSTSLGFSKTLFLGRDLVLVKGNFKEILQGCRSAQDKKTIYVAENEEMLRLVVEKSPVDLVLGVEKIFWKDSLHYPKSGLNQVLCNLAKKNNKSFGLSFADMLHAKHLGKLMHRMAFNLHLGKKYGLKMILSNFSSQKEEMRSSSDLESLRRVLEGI